MKNHLLPLALLSLAPAAAADVSFPDFVSGAGLQLNGNAAIAGGRLVLTPDQTNQVGSAWATTKQKVSGGFDTTFRFQITNGNADGFAFVLHNDAVDAIGGNGSCLGYGCGVPNEIRECVVIEFDTYDAGRQGDPSPNHVSVHAKLGTLGLENHANSLGSSSTIPIMKDGSVHTGRIEYLPGTMNVFVDDLVNPALTVAIDVPTTITLDEETAWVGFTGATGGLTQLQEIIDWTFDDKSGISGSPDQISLTTGGVQILTIDGGVALAGATYFVAGSVTGTTPGIPFRGQLVPLNPDPYLLFTLANPGAPPLLGGAGTLNSLGQSSAQFVLQPGTDPALAGLTVHHAAAFFQTSTFTLLEVTDAVSCSLVP